MSEPLVLLIQQLQQELQNQRVEIQQLRSDITSLRIQTQSQQPPISRLPDPPRFNGKPYTLRTWLPSVKAKLRSDQLSGADAFDYVWDRLEQPQQASVLHLRQLAEDTQVWNPEDIFSFFQRLCHNPREQQEATQRFIAISQRDDESLTAYLARFERLSYEAQTLSWPDTSRITTLHRGLRSTLRHALESKNDSLFTLPYDDYITLVQSADRRTQPSFQKPAYFQPGSQKLVRAKSPDPDQMDLGPIRLHTARISSRSPPPRPYSPPLSTSSNSSRLSYRLVNNLCFYCGSNDHWIENCPSSSSTRSQQTAYSSTMSKLYGKPPAR
jgi:hypothetical protein